MSRVIDLEEGRLLMAVKRGFRNWVSRFGERFDSETRLGQLSAKTVSHLAQGKEKGTFYLYDLIMSLGNLGSGFEFNDLSPKQKMAVIDRYLFLLDQIRFECMKRLGWLESYPGEDFPLVELVMRFEELGPRIQAKIPLLSRDHSGYQDYCALNTFDREAFVRKLIPRAIKEIQDSSTTL
jgi:hypothetical protein